MRANMLVPVSQAGVSAAMGRAFLHRLPQKRTTVTGAMPLRPVELLRGFPRSAQVACQFNRFFTSPLSEMNGILILIEGVQFQGL